MALGTKVSVNSVVHPRYRWVATFHESGKPKRKYFKTKKAAKDFAGDRSEEAEKSGIGDHVTSDERATLNEFRQRIESLGVDLRTVIETEVCRRERGKESIPVSDAVERFIELKEQAGKSDSHISDVRFRLRRFAAAMGDVKISDISTDELDTWLLGLKSRRTKKRISDTSWGNYRRHLIIFFKQCMIWKYCDSNPAKDTQKPEAADREPGILTPAQASDLLNSSPEEFRPAIALGLFAGLRSSEIQRIDWAEINLETETITLKGAVTKKKFRRVIPIRANLKKWLVLHSQKNGAVAPSGYRWRKLFDEARRNAGFKVRRGRKDDTPKGKDWPDNGMRHSYASYGLQFDQDHGKIALELGHRGSAQTLYDHYRATCEPSDAASYWSIVPEQAENIVSIAS